jgi:hypothetical protein
MHAGALCRAQLSAPIAIHAAQSREWMRQITTPPINVVWLGTVRKQHPAQQRRPHQVQELH